MAGAGSGRWQGGNRQGLSNWQCGGLCRVAREDGEPLPPHRVRRVECLLVVRVMMALG